MRPQSGRGFLNLRESTWPGGAGQANSSLIKQKYTLKEGVPVCLRGEQCSEVPVGGLIAGV